MSGFIALPQARILGASGVPVSVTGTTASTSLGSVVIPARAVGPNGVLRITSLWGFSGSAGTKVYRIYAGSQQVRGVTVAAAVGTMSDQFARWNRNSYTQQVSIPSGFGGSYGSSNVIPFETTVDTQESLLLDFRAQLTDAADSATLEAYLVEVLNK